MNKSLEAALHGYIRFAVNGKRYWLYNSALAACRSVHGDMAVEFCGLHVIKGWRLFYARVCLYSREEVKDSELHAWLEASKK